MGGLSKLIVLCDGMWCGRETKTETNIYMLARLMGIPVECGEDSRDDDDFQARYFDGPGMGNAVLDLIFTGSTSPDIATRCIDIYKYIVDHFTDKHEIWMFGLGRGAYVVRCVAGMINNCGIIKKSHDDHGTAVLVNHVYSMYETLGHDCRPSSPRMVRFRSRSSWEVSTPVRFMGILDTTDPAGLPYFLSLAISKHPPVYDINASSAVKSVYHAISIHERLSLFDLCIPEDTAEMQAEVSSSIHEMWFPGMHYDLGRQKFPLGAGAAGRFLPWLPWLTIHPNLVLSDLVLIWMLESIGVEDSSGTLIPDIGRQIEVLGRRLTQGQLSKGSGDIYARIQPLRYVTYWAWFLPGSWTPTLRERRILDFNATAYDYRRPIDQSGATIWSLAEISERYPSVTYDDFQLYRWGTGEIDQATYECLLGRECIEQKASLMPGGLVPLTISWQGPNFRAVHGSTWKDVLTITKVSPDGEYYVARTMTEFLSEFYGDLGASLLDCVTKLCVFKARMSNTTGESQPSVSSEDEISGIYQVHLHIEVDSITAYFADTSLRATLPTSGANKVRLLSALSWVVAVLQTPKLGAEGLFKVSCKVEDTEGTEKWSSQCEQYRPGKKESSCWTQLFDYACIAEVPRDFHIKPSNRPEGLEIEFDLLVHLSRASRPIFTEYGVVLVGFDTALIQLRPVDSRRWHVVRTPGSFISPVDILKAIEFTGQSSTDEREIELNNIHDAIQSSFNLSAEAKEPESVQPRGAIKSSLRLDKRARRAESRVFEYPPGKVYVGWCDSPTASIGTQVPDANFLDKFDSQTAVPEVTANILALSSVTTVTSATIGARLGFLGSLISGDYTYGRTRQRTVEQTTVEYQFTLPGSRLRAAGKTPVILWDDSTRRAWLLPGVSVLFFVSICLFELLELVFEGPMRYVTPSDNPGEKALVCLQGNWRLRLIDPGAQEPTDITFGDLVLDLWQGMKEAQSVCYATTNNRKHYRDGVVFGYDLYDLLGIGRIPLRYLDETRAGANLRTWEPLARKESLQVIFCSRVGSVIKCAAGTCAGMPCEQFCQYLHGTNGVLSCLLPDFKRFFGDDWGRYSESGILPVTPGFEWIPTSPDIFIHFGESLPSGGVCECCSQLSRLQSIVRHTTPSIIKRLFRRSPLGRTVPTPFRSAAWLEQAYAVRFGAR